MAGSDYVPRGWNWSFGAYASLLGFGPKLVTECCFSPVSARLETSVLAPPPWAWGIVRGFTITAGLTIAAPIPGSAPVLPNGDNFKLDL